jgi:hypothetical protein
MQYIINYMSLIILHSSLTCFTYFLQKENEHYSQFRYVADTNVLLQSNGHCKSLGTKIIVLVDCIVYRYTFTTSNDVSDKLIQWRRHYLRYRSYAM